MNKVKVTYYGMDGEGTNVTEAKRDAGNKIEAIINADFTPCYLELGNIRVIVFRDVFGWHYSFLTKQENIYNWASTGRDREATIISAKSHIAQNYYNGSNKAECLDYLDDRQERANLATWIKFQERYAEARAQGKTDVEAHAIACGY